MPTVSGAVALVLAAVVLLPGIDALSDSLYRDGDGDMTAALAMLIVGGIILAGGAALLVIGRRRHAAEMNRGRGYAEQHDGHSLRTEDRPTNPYDTQLRGHQTGTWT